MKKHITQNRKLGISKKRRKGENSTINKMNVWGKIVSMPVQVNREKPRHGLIWEPDLVQAKRKKRKKKNETETRIYQDFARTGLRSGDRKTRTEGNEDETINETVHYVKNTLKEGMKKESKIPEENGSGRKKEKLGI